MGYRNSMLLLLSLSSLPFSATLHMAMSTLERSKAVPFNGGKINHIFTPGRGVYETGFYSPEAEACFKDPETSISLKVHGECAILLKQKIDETQAEWIFATRLDTGGRKDPPDGAIPLPMSPQPSLYEKHHYWFIPLARNLVTGKGKKMSKMGPETYSAIASGVASGDLPDPNDADCPDHITVEWIGRKHQGNVDNVNADHALYVHGSVNLDYLLPPPRSREQVEEMARTVSIEGIILYHPATGERYKIRLDMFSDSLFKKRKKLPVDNETTSIKPKVVMDVQNIASSTT